jgi:hypothetical protein
MASLGGRPRGAGVAIVLAMTWLKVVDNREVEELAIAKENHYGAT